MELDETACALIKQLLQDDKAVVADTTEDKECYYALLFYVSLPKTVFWTTKVDGGEDSGDISYRSFLVEVRNAQVNFIGEFSLRSSEGRNAIIYYFLGEETVQEGCVVLSIPSGRMIKYLGSGGRRF
jgi:hypothetical protein